MREYLRLVPLSLFLAVASASDYAGAAACRQCHPDQFAAQNQSAHAAALARSKPPQPGEWAFGADTQAITFVSRIDRDHYLEHGHSWYRKLNGFARTPGHRDTAGIRYRLYDPAAGILRCFACHSTGPLEVTADQTILPHELGVRCEACHGPAAAHAKDPSHVRPQNPGKLNGADLNNFCGQCHRMPAAAGETPDLRAPWNARHQPLLLAASVCFRESGGRVTCLTCHSPHAPLERNPAAYDAKCAECHPGVKHKVAIAKKPCAECHMPAVRPQANLVFANHRIGVYNAADPMKPRR